ncbi:retrotransposon protein, putative, ty1-copia subclass [Tanacetum coccineum]
MVDYEETFSPVADIRAIRILIAISTYYDYEIWQIDVKTAFLNGHLLEEVYMEQPEDVKSYLGRCFAMKDLGEAAYILGIKIYIDRSWRLIGLCQSAYIKKILKRSHMESSKHGSIPMQEKLKLSKSQGASTHAEIRRMHNVPYALAVGSIMYAVRCTRPDVAFAQNITSRFQQNPCDLHWTTAKNIRKYVRNTKDMFLVYGEPINMYCDNTGAIAIANESRITKGARHFRAKVHYLREVIEYGDIKLEKVHTYDNLADHFPKRGVTDWYQEPRVMSTYPIIVPSNSDIEDTFSSTNSPDYTPASPDYFLASPGNISLDPSKDLTKYLLASLAISPFHDDPYMKVVQAYNATNNELPIPSPQAPIASSTVLPSSLVLPLSPLFDS